MSWDDIETPLTRARRRFERSHAIYERAFEDEDFHDLVAVLVTGAYYETILWNAILIDSRKPMDEVKDLALKPLVNEALKRGLIDQSLSDALRSFADIRNDFAHDIECRLDPERIDTLAAQLPHEYLAHMDQCLGNMPGFTVGAKARVVFGELARWTWARVRSTLHTRFLAAVASSTG